MKTKLTFTLLATLLLIGCGDKEPTEEWKGAERGDNCLEKYKDPANQSRCNLLIHEG